MKHSLGEPINIITELIFHIFILEERVSNSLNKSSRVYLT